MRVEDLFLANGNVRPIWRFLLSLVLGVFAYVVASVLAAEVWHFTPRPGARYGTLFLFELLVLLAAFKFMTQVFERKPFAVIGLAFHPYWLKELCVGAGVGGVMMILVGGCEALMGVARFSPNPLPAGSELAYGSGLFLLLLVAATNEELVFRGYPFQRLVESFGPVGAVAISSAFFGLAHLGNAHHTWISTANTMLVGVPLSLAYLRTRSLWMPVGLHFAWNYMQGFIFGLPVSGYAFSTTLLKVQIHGAAWLTGSDYGPEGGMLSTVAVVGAALFLFLSPHIRINEKMKELVFGPSPDAFGDTAFHITSKQDPGGAS